MNLRLKIIIGLMSIALLGLVWIQFYWIDSAIALKKDEFNQKVSLAMRRVVHDLERYDAMENLRRHHLGRQLIHEQMRKRKKLMMQHRREAMKLRAKANRLERKSKRDNARLRIEERYSNDSSELVIRQEFVNADTNVLLSQLKHQTEVLDDIILDLMEFDQFRSIEERINHDIIDSLLEKEFSELMLNTKVVFAVFDYFGRDITSEENDNEDALRSSVYKARLFPNDMFGEPFFLSLYFPNQKTFLLKSMWMTLSVSTLFLLLIVGAFAYTIHVIQNQKQLSLIKNDFISNMTHELKTPISTISLACEALGDKDISDDQQRKNRFLNMISQENNRLAMLVENVLKSSIWDKSDFKLQLEEVDLHQIIQDVNDSMKMIVEQKEGRLDLNLKAAKSVLHGDKVHLTNIIYNLLDNAIKYSKENPEIVISTSNTNKEFLVEVKDNGIGISKDQQKKIFDKFYRVPTGNIHNVKGFGLGLNYVQNVVRNHGGEIQVKSSSGKGSTFLFRIPFNFNA